MKKNILLIAFFFVTTLMIDPNYAQSNVVMNEIYSRGTSEAPDWIEIYNPTGAAIDLTGYKIYDSGGQSGSKPKKEIPNGTVIPANGFLVIVTDDTAESGFGLSSSGEEVWLEDAAGNVIDDVQFPAMETTQSYGRFPDGSENWQLLNTITKGETNSPAEVNYILMNEIYSRGTSEAPDWIEVYNTSTSEIDISGYKIYDSGGQSGSKPKKEIPNGTVIPANGFLVIVTDDTAESGFGLSSSGEEVWLEDAAGNVIDSVNFPALETSQSYSRIPDGGETWKVTNTVTRNTSNIFSTETYILMNEIYSRGTSEAPDWIEIYNTSTSEVDISGYKIYDSGGQSGSKPKKEIPNGTVIPANGFLVIVTDDTAESGFGLSSSGEEVWLEDAAGNVIDDVQFPAMETTQSYGRFPDGSESWQLLNTITKGSSNIITDIKSEPKMLSVYSLAQNYPNPFNPSTVINYSIPFESHVKLVVYNSIGQVVKELANSVKQQGDYSEVFNASGLSSGIYFYKIIAVSTNGKSTFNQVKKMIYMK